MEIKDLEEWKWWAKQVADSGLGGRNTSPPEVAIRMRIAQQIGLDPVAGALEIGVISGRPVIAYAAIHAAMQRAGYTIVVVEEEEWSIKLAVHKEGVETRYISYTKQDFIDAGDLMPDGTPAQTRNGHQKVKPSVRRGVLFGRAIRLTQSRCASEAMAGLAVIEKSEARMARETQRERDPEPEVVKAPAAKVSVSAGHPVDNPEPPPVDKTVDKKPEMISQAVANWLVAVESLLGEEPFKGSEVRIKKFVAKSKNIAWLDLDAKVLEGVYKWLKKDPAAALAAAKGQI